MAAILAVACAVAGNQILNDGVWRWLPWAPLAVCAALVGVVVADRLTRGAGVDLPASPGGRDDASVPQGGEPLRFGAVPPRAGYFQDRDLANLLASHLEHGDMVILTGTRVLAGLGGVGKTQLAADHAHRLWTEQKVDLLAWITAGSRRDIELAYARLATRVNDLNTDRPHEDADPRLLGWLATTRRRWLIVLDDLVEPGDLRGLWPPSSPTGQVLVTTRRRDAALRGEHRHVLDVGLFTDSEAVAYLAARLPCHERADMIGLATDLGRLPLALAQATAYLADRPLLTCSGYRQRLRDHRTSLARVLPAARELPDEQLHTVAATWSFSIERADQLDPVGLARPLLELTSVLDTAGVPTALFTTSAVRSYLAGRSGDPGRAEDALGCLYRLSLASLDRDQPARAVRVHALVQRVTRESLSTAELATTAVVAAEAILELWPGDGYELGTSLRSNAAALIEHARAHLLTCDARRLLLLVGDDLVDQHRYAVTYFQELLDEAVRTIGANHPDTLAIRDRLARCHAEAGEFDSAVIQAEHLLAGRSRLLGADHVDTLTARHDLAQWHTQAGRPKDALAELDVLVPAQTRALTWNDKLVLKTRLERAITRADAGDPATAVTELERLLAEQTQAHGPEDRIPLHTRAWLVLVRIQAKQHVRATAEFELLIADRMRIMAPCDRIIPVLNSSLTSRYDERGEKNTWNIQRRDLMIDAPRLPYRGSYQQLLGRYDAINGNAAYHTEYAVEELMTLLTDALYVWGGDNPLTLAIRHNLAKWQEWSGDILGAVVEWELLASDQLRILGADHPDTLATWARLTALGDKRAEFRPVELWQRSRDRRLALGNERKRPRRWPDRTPVDEALRNLRADGVESGRARS